MKIEPIEGWRKSHKLASVRMSVFFAALFGVGPDLLHAWHFIPEDLKNALPDGMSRWIALSAFLLVLLGRIFSFDGKKEGDFS